MLGAQQLTQDGKVKIMNTHGASNPPDLGTKHLDAGSIRRTLERCHCYVREGSFGSALRVQELTRPHPDVFILDDAVESDTQAERHIEFGSNDSGSSDSCGTETAAEPFGVNSQ